ncbi:MAG: hypothetical protein QM621_15035 [Aeromicrobium sp.]|uniref:hypothetical protein n=1 Tax=Aeromicrobium sp. TaxID=1871063 RepID=UPI0039E27924
MSAFNDRMWDDLHLTDASEPFIPDVAVVLLYHLGVIDAPRNEQIAAIRDWLTAHTPSEPLLSSLQRDGYASASGLTLSA